MTEFKGREWSKLVRFEHDTIINDKGDPVVILKNTIESYKTHEEGSAVEVIKRIDVDGKESFTMAVDGTEIEHKDAEGLFTKVSDGTKEEAPQEPPVPTEEEAKQKSDDVVKDVEAQPLTEETNGDPIKDQGARA